MKRTVTFKRAEGFDAATRETPRNRVEQAAGYLALWGAGDSNSNKTYACVFMQADGNISADYYKVADNDEVTTQAYFTLFGLLSQDKQSYSFHS